MEDGSDPILAPGDSCRLVVLCMALGMFGSLGAMETVCGGRRMEGWLVAAPHDLRAALQRCVLMKV